MDMHTNTQRHTYEYIDIHRHTETHIQTYAHRHTYRHTQTWTHRLTHRLHHSLPRGLSGRRPRSMAILCTDSPARCPVGGGIRSFATIWKKTGSD